MFWIFAIVLDQDQTKTRPRPEVTVSIAKFAIIYENYMGKTPMGTLSEIPSLGVKA